MTASESGSTKLPLKEAAAVVKIKFASGDNLASILGRYGTTNGDVYRIVQAMKPYFSPRDFHCGDLLTLSFFAHKAGASVEQRTLSSLSFVSERDVRLTVSRAEDGGFAATTKILPHIKSLKFAVGTVGRRGFVSSAMRSGVPRCIALEMIRAVGPRMHLASAAASRGTRFEVFYEEFDDGKERGGKHYGKVLYLDVSKDSKENPVAITLFRYISPTGVEGYFDEQGVGSETLYSLIPVKGGELSSLMGRRMHPVLKKWRTHKGLDYSARRNAPIYAAADGNVDYKGRNGGYGRYVRLHHADGRYTAYAHMSRYADGLRRGDTVRKGQIIGYVGASGIATGPNLHYEVQDAQRRAIDPLQTLHPSVYRIGRHESIHFQTALLNLGTLLASDQGSPERLVAAARVREHIRPLHALSDEMTTVSSTLSRVIDEMLTKLTL